MKLREAHMQTLSACEPCCMLRTRACNYHCHGNKLCPHVDALYGFNLIYNTFIFFQKEGRKKERISAIVRKFLIVGPTGPWWWGLQGLDGEDCVFFLLSNVMDLPLYSHCQTITMNKNAQWWATWIHKLKSSVTYSKWLTWFYLSKVASNTTP